MKGLYFYKLVSPYTEDITKDCKLTINEIDSNFLTLKDNDIKSAEFNEEQNIITLTRNNNDTIVMNLSSIVDAMEDKISGMTSNLDVIYDEVDGVILINYNDKQVKIEDLITKQNLSKEILASVYTDATLNGLGTIKTPLHLAPTERTGIFRTAEKLINLTDGGVLPSPNDLEKGDRFVTFEEVCDYGYLYNFEAVKRINEDLKHTGWRVPTKADWDSMLNAIEPCAYRNHDSIINNNILGKVAGKLLKTQDKWVEANDFNGEVETVETEPNVKVIEPNGVNSFGLSIVPSGYGFNNKPPHWSRFGVQGGYWSSTMLFDTDVYVKVFMNNQAGVLQIGENPNAYLSVRLVHDYDGHNHENIASIQGVDYETVLMPSLDADNGYTIWTADNLSIKSDKYPYLIPNNNVDVTYSTRFIINEWDGFDWVRKEMKEGDGIILKEGLKGDVYEEYRIINGEFVSVREQVTTDIYNLIKTDIETLKSRVDTLVNVSEQHSLDISELQQSTSQLRADIDSEIQRSIEKDDELDNEINNVIKPKLLSLNGHIYDCANGVLILKNDGGAEITIQLDSNYGTFLED